MPRTVWTSSAALRRPAGRRLEFIIRMPDVTLAACVISLLAATPLSAQRQVHVPRDRVTRMASDSAVRAGVPILSTRGVGRTAVTSSGFQLESGTFAAFRVGERATVVPGPSEAAADTFPRPLPVPDPLENPFLALPFRLLTPDATATGTWVLRPVYKVATRLRWEPDSNVFRGAIFIAVEDSIRRSESRPLPTPVRFQLLGEADRVEPDRIELVHTNFPLQRIDVVARNVTDSLRVHIVPEFDVRGADVWIPVEPSLIVETSPRRIQGWGVGNARVIVRVIGGSTRRPSAVSLSASAGELDSVAVAIGASATGTTRLRSSGAGLATLTASAPGFNAAQSSIEFVWPLAFFMLAVLGGVFGGLGAAAQNKTGRRKARWGEFALKGVFAGLLAALVWYALGVNLLQLDVGMPRFNELAVFTFAAVAGYFGIPRVGKAA